MRRGLDLGLIVGFLAVDFLFFHDIFKAGEVTTVPQYMTGLLSIVVFARCGWSLLRHTLPLYGESAARRDHPDLR